MLRIQGSYVDYSNVEITNIDWDEGLLRSTIILNLKMGANDLVIDDIPNEMVQ